MSEIGTIATPKAIVEIIEPGSKYDEGTVQNWGTPFSHALQGYNVDWGIITDGQQLKVLPLKRKDYQKVFLWGHLDRIIEQESIDSFVTLYQMISLIKSDGNIENVKFEKSTIKKIAESSKKQSEKVSSPLESYIHLFAHLNTQGNRKYWPEITKFHAPHKPILLLSILDLYSKRLIQSNKIEIVPELINKYEEYWWTILPELASGDLAYPFFYLRSDHFWNLIPIPGKEIKLEVTKDIKYTSKLKKLVSGAYLDYELFQLLVNKNHRNVLRAVLIQTYFDTSCYPILCKLSNTNYREFEKSLNIIN